MTKTVKELMLKVQKENYLAESQPLAFEQGFALGVDAVLWEIRKLMKISQIRSYHEVYEDIDKLIKQFKEE